MRSFSVVIAIFYLPLSIIFAQQDPSAMKILDEFSAKATAAPSVSIKFDIVTDNQAEGTTDTVTGSVLLSKDKYRLQLPENTIFFNGQTSWSYLPAEKEVTVTNPDKEDDTFFAKPSSIFSEYKEGYKCRLIEEKQAYWIIDLYPEDTANELIRMRLTIGKTKYNLISLEYKRKDGVTHTLKVLDYSLTQKPSQDAFTFQKDKFRDVEVIDMR